jgi:hypothetical protein
VRIGLFEIDVMPFWTWFQKSGCNLNGEDIFVSWQIGCLEIRKFKSKRHLHLWIDEK